MVALKILLSLTCAWRYALLPAVSLHLHLSMTTSTPFQRAEQSWPHVPSDILLDNVTQIPVP